MKIGYSGDGSAAALTCRLYSAANEGQYWTTLYDDGTGFIVSQDLEKGAETTVDLSLAKLTGTQKIFFMFAGIENFEADFTVTVSSGK